VAAGLSGRAALRLSYGLALAAFVALAVAVWADPEPAADRQALDALWEPPLTQAPLVEAATALGDARVLAVAAVAVGALLWCRGRRRLAPLPLLAVVGGVVIVQVTKLLVARPTTWFPIWGRLTTTNDSFPSGHALQAIVFWGLMAALVLAETRSAGARWLVLAATALVVAVAGYTRVYLGHHWPSDVLGGWLAGWAWLGALLALRQRLVQSHE
jgi:membrane-associated phospholipid phosphatase